MKAADHIHALIAWRLACTVLGLLLPGLAAEAHGRGLSFSERVAAQERIERVYSAHQISASKPFEEAVPRALIEAKVRRSLKQSLALERFWKTPITAEMLRREAARIGRSSRMPERLDELLAALGQDRILFEETVVRAVLADRLIRNFYSMDRTMHAATRARAEELRDRLLGDGGTAAGSMAELEVVVFRRTSPLTPHGIGRTSAGSLRVVSDPMAAREITSEEFERLRETTPRLAVQVLPIEEDRDAFSVRAVLEESADQLRLATIRVPKRSWESWWGEVAPHLNDTESPLIARRSAWLDDASNPRSSPIFLGADSDRTRGRVPSPASCVPDDSWDSVPLLPTVVPRWGHESVWTGSLMLVWGSEYGSETGGRYDPALDQWMSMSVVGAPRGRTAPTSVWTGTEMIVWGGLSPTGTTLRTGGRYDPVSDTWIPTGLNGAPVARQFHSAVWTGTEMIVWGGRESNAGGQLEDGGRYDPATDAWLPTSTVGVPAPRESHSAVWTGSEMIVWGGFRGTSLQTGGRYNPSTNTWLPTNSSAPGLPAARTQHSAVWTGDLMIVWGGYAVAGTLRTGSRYNPATDSWRPTDTSSSDVPAGRADHTAVWTGTEMIIWGGQRVSTAGVLDDGSRYNPIEDSWNAVQSAGAPERRQLHTAVWTGALMIVWGGTSGVTLLPASGGRYDPATDSWTPTSLQSIGPGGRLDHSAVWTGARMIVWGGSDSPGLDLYTNTGGVYDPALDAWTFTSLVNAPSPRARHVTVWTGSEMIVWGGRDLLFDNLATGGRYDPVSDTWTPTTRSGAPPGRQFATAVWSGSEMLVWGGTAGGYFFDSLGRYDPESDTWTRTGTQPNEPSGRVRHSAIWTGDRMLIWGGSGLSSPTNTGALYDPATDSWQTINAGAGAPTPRCFHSAVWVTGKLFVWGGDAAGCGVGQIPPVPLGAIYDSLTDSWKPISDINAPSPRLGHSAIWTGNQMVVWGGHFSVLPFVADTGGRYDPSTDTWTSTTISAAPLARGSHSALWTGSSMLVWGGATFDGQSSPAVGNGGAYDPGPSVTDNDGDGHSECVGLVHDCDDSDPAAFAIPGEIQDLRWSGSTTLTWVSAAPTAGSSALHDVLRSELTSLPVGSGLDACLASGLVENTAEDPAYPPPGWGWWYLIRGRTSCGVGTYGAASDGTPRLSDACP